MSLLFFINSIAYANSDICVDDNLYVLNECQSEWLAFETENKIYIKTEAIVLTNNSFYIVVGTSAAYLKNLYKDDFGYFVFPAEVWWKCRYCGYLNGPDFNACQNCHKAKRHPKSNVSEHEIAAFASLDISCI
jgi:hypothetical protein